MGFKKTRYAPTPSGFLHLGNLYSMALTASIAKKEGASVLLRLDDMDHARAKNAYLQDIFDCLNFFGLPWQEGPKNLNDHIANYTQSSRLGLYNTFLEELKAKGKIFACACSRNEIAQAGSDSVYPGTCRNKAIDLNANNVCWRLDTSANLELHLKEYGQASARFFLPENMQHFIVRRKDGLPSYQVCSLIDDVHFGVDLIVRGADLRDSSLAQLYLAQLNGMSEFLNCTFLHHALLHNTRGKKLSKSAGDLSLRHLITMGQERQSIYHEMGHKLNLSYSLSSWSDLVHND